MDWIDELVQELGLEDTVPGEEQEKMSVLELIRTVHFTNQGWASVRRSLLERIGEADSQLFRDVLEENSDLFRAFLGVIKMPYSLGRNLKYPKEACEQLALLTTYALVIGMSKGYEHGKAAKAEEESA